jgi:hypothetical protein
VCRFFRSLEMLEVLKSSVFSLHLDEHPKVQNHTDP